MVLKVPSGECWKAFVTKGYFDTDLLLTLLVPLDAKRVSFSYNFPLCLSLFQMIVLKISSVTSSHKHICGGQYLPPPCCVLEQRHIYSPKSNGNTQKAVAPSRHD